MSRIARQFTGGPRVLRLQLFEIGMQSGACAPQLCSVPEARLIVARGVNPGEPA